MRPQQDDIKKRRFCIEKVIFLGTPEFAVPTLERLAESKFKPQLVVTQPDKKQGRNLRLTATPVKQKAFEYGIETMQPDDVNEEYVVDLFASIEPDVIVTVAYGGLLKKEILNTPKFSCINLHPSLLPKYRGAAPINYALFNGDKITGNSVFRMVRKMDRGPILYQSEMKIEDNDNATSLSEKLSVQGADDIITVLEAIEQGKITETAQNEDLATYSNKLTKEDILINWNKSAEKIICQVKGLALEPGGFTFFRGQRLKVLEVKPAGRKSDHSPGTIVCAGDLSKHDSRLNDKGILVATADENLIIKQVQLAGKKMMSAFDFNLGAKIKPFEVFTNEH